MKTKDEIILETLQEYLLHPERRSVSGTSCRYNGPDGKHCAFARCVEEENRGLLQESLKASLQDKTLIKKDYQGHDGDFWNFVQSIHDFALPMLNMNCLSRLQRHLASFPQSLKYLNENASALNLQRQEDPIRL